MNVFKETTKDTKHCHIRKLLNKICIWKTVMASFCDYIILVSYVINVLVVSKKMFKTKKSNKKFNRL